MRLHTWSTTQWCPGAGRCSSTTHLHEQLTKVVYWSNLQHKYSSSECMGHLFWQNTFYTTTPHVAVDLLVQCIHCWHTPTIRAGDTIRADFTRASTDLTHKLSFDSTDITEEISRSLKKIAPNSETLLEPIIEILYFKLLAYFFNFI